MKSVPDIAWHWEDAQYCADWHEPVYETTLRCLGELPSGASVLEVGGGGSHTLGALAVRREQRCVAVDPSLAGLAAVHRMMERGARCPVDLIRGDGFRLPFRDGAFDAVYSLGVIEHFSSDQSAALVAEHVRVCRPGGRVVVATPNLLNLPHTAHKLIAGRRYAYYPERSYTFGQLARLLKRSGLRIVAVEGCRPLWGLAMTRVGWPLVDALTRLGITERLERVPSRAMRALIGYMVFVVGEKS